jgi:homoserine kinase
VEKAFSSLKDGRGLGSSDCIEVRALIAAVLTVMRGSSLSHCLMTSCMWGRFHCQQVVQHAASYSTPAGCYVKRIIPGPC